MSLSAGGGRFLPLRLGDGWMALDAARVVQILGPLPLVPLPASPQFVPGVVAFRGRAVPVVDLGALLGLSALWVPGEPRARTVVLAPSAGGRAPSRAGLGALVAVQADAAHEVFFGVPEAGPAPGSPFIAGYVRFLEALAPIADVGRVLLALAPAAPGGG